MILVILGYLINQKMNEVGEETLEKKEKAPFTHKVYNVSDVAQMFGIVRMTLDPLLATYEKHKCDTGQPCLSNVESREFSSKFYNEYKTDDIEQLEKFICDWILVQYFEESKRQEVQIV